MTVPTRTPLNWVKPFCKKYADIREAIKYFLRTFSVEGVENAARKGHLNLFLAHPAILGKAISSKGTNQ